MRHGAMFLLLVITPALAQTEEGTGWWRWPYSQSPYVIQKNPSDGYPDFAYFDGSNASLTPTTINCPTELQRECSKTTKHGSDEACGSDGLNVCKGGLYCDISKHHLKGEGLLPTYLPQFKGPACPHKNSPTCPTPNMKSIPRTRTNILQRAIGWLAVHAPYFGCKIPKFKYDGLEMCAADDAVECPQWTYTLTCEGLVEMAWSSPHYGGGGSDSVDIHYSELLPGDAITIEKYNTTTGKHKGTSHYLMFREWIVPNKVARVYQMGGEHGTSNMVIMGTTEKPVLWCENAGSHKSECKGTKRYAHLVKDEAEEKAADRSQSASATIPEVVV